MEVIFENSFYKDLRKIPAGPQKQIQATIVKLIAAKSLQESGVDYKKFGNSNYYRIRVGQYRIGIEYVSPKVIVMRAMIRGQIYKQFPPGK